MKRILQILCLILVSQIFNGAKCSKSPVEPETPIDAPSLVTVWIQLNQNLQSFATVTWEKSPQHDKSEFKGYFVITYIVDRSGKPVQALDSIFIPKVDSRKVILSNIEVGIRYRTDVYSVDLNNKRSKPASSIIYAGVFYGEGTIEQFRSDSTTNAGFGWEPFSGSGNQYKFIHSNFANIDLHLRVHNNLLTFFSPDFIIKNTNVRKTRFYLLPTTGQKAFEDILSLEEPSLTGVSVNKDNVYLLRTNDSIYVKLWVKDIRTVGSGVNAYQSVDFAYRLQPIVNLRVVKK